MTRRIAGALVALGLTLAVVAAVVWANGGWSVAVLMSPSMEPFASSGDLLVHREVSAEDIEVGDVVTVPAPDDRLATQRVVHLARSEDAMVRARLQGDASPLPDPVPVLLHGQVPRVVVVVPWVGRVLTAGAALLWAGVVLLAAGGIVLLVARGSPVGADRAPPVGADRAPPVGAERTPSEPSPTDPRVTALLATCEQLADDEVPAVVLRDLVRVRVATLLGLRSAERAGAVLALDDGARFYVIALADADPRALATIPPSSDRRRRASAAIDLWWEVVEQDVPPAVTAQLDPWL